MPRPKNIRKDMRKGLKRLNRYLKLPLDNKIRYANRLIEYTLSIHTNPVVCWSGGKDSTVLLHLILKHKPDIQVIFNDSGVEFPETLDFVKFLKKAWSLNLHIVRPIGGESFWDCVKQYGWPIFGKATAMSVEKARRSGNYRAQLSELERNLLESNVQISSRCCLLLKEKPSKKIESILNSDLKYLGLMASESRNRTRLWVDHGDYYYVKRYFGRKRGIWKASPLSIWREKDIWGYHSKHDMPYCKLYDKGHVRNGCWPCAMGVRRGQLKRLRNSHPKLFDHLICETNLGKELIKARLGIDGSEAGEDNIDVRTVLRNHPCFFDKF